MALTTRRAFLLWLGWATLIVYGSLMPFEWRPHTLAEAINQFRHIPYLQLGVVSRADWIANILLYIPLGYTGALWLARRHHAGLIPAALLCLGLAIAVEFTQIFFAPRTVSQNDLIAEGIGTALGLALWQAGHGRFADLLQTALRPGPTALMAGLTLYSLAYLVLAFFPYDFLLSTTDLVWKLREGNYGWGLDGCGPLVQCGGQWLGQAVAAVPLGLLLSRLLQGGHLSRALLGLLAAASIGIGIEAGQFLLASGVTTVTSAIAQSLGIGAGFWLRQLPSPQLAQRHAAWLRPLLLFCLLPYLTLIALLNHWFTSAWVTSAFAQAKLAELHFLPFYYHYFTSETQAVTSLMAQTGSYLPLGAGFWLWHASGPTPLRRPPQLGLLLLAAASASIIEAGKLFLAGEHPDPTNILIALAAAWLGLRLCHWLARCQNSAATMAAHGPAVLPLIGASRRQFLGAGLTLLALGGIGLAMIRQTADSEATLLAGIHHTLPAPKSLGPISLPNFRLEHPRLPAPTPADILRLQKENREFLGLQRRLAQEGRGQLQSAILMAYLEPGSQDLQAIFNRLMALEFTWRGHEQGKPLAQGYDWLYAYWSQDQRRQLQEKLVHGCNYLIDQIRGQTLSPYNVYLYNSPFQALMACSIALYKDDPRGEPVMAFTQDLWKNRVLPVWRQVMGKNGGWHEGGEYIGLGIGSAIYQLPNMWRRATGEDYFRIESGIRGFLDFLVYRTRPDDTHIRLGDAAWFDRDSPDRLALALEYRHAAAYSLGQPPKAPTPTSWPWGPLTDPGLYDPKAVETLPLTKHFDGIGLVVMRSGWGPDATYITFKAGDNYWSHSHLDQGSFTLYKGGELAVDSGLYHDYGSDHHMNYTYQTIAHNVVTVTDPADTVPMPSGGGNRPPRSIANDGGQRRIGSGWGVDPAPLDVAEWNAKREIYHTGKITQLTEQDGVTTIVADITPAYTNRYSGQGTFSHRTRRVEQYIRTFVYDRLNDAIVVHDSIKSTKPEFTPRWLLHTIEEPALSSGSFQLEVTPRPRPAHGGGHLTGTILLPEQAEITKIGGPGKEFMVAGRNYDNDGNVYQVLKSRPLAEAGAWRVEIAPTGGTSTVNNFLVALTLKKNQSEPAPLVQCSQETGLIACLIHGKEKRKLQITAKNSAIFPQESSSEVLKPLPSH